MPFNGAGIGITRRYRQARRVACAIRSGTVMQVNLWLGSGSEKRRAHPGRASLLLAAGWRLELLPLLVVAGHHRLGPGHGAAWCWRSFGAEIGRASCRERA